MTTEIEVEIFSKQLIKPSSPTPHHLRCLRRLSFIDQIQAHILFPFVLFYSRNPTVPNLRRFDLLRKSLSDALTIFYPLAGRIKNNFHIDCNDGGTLFAEARANCHLSDVLQNKYSNHFQNYKFVPLQHDEGDNLVASCQVTFFKCGGYAISFAMSHKLRDAFSQFIFLRSWAAVTKGMKVDMPSFCSASLFPPKRLPGMVHAPKEKVAVRVFVFDASTISAIRDKYTFDGKKLSRVQALAAFIWSRFIAVAQANDVNTKHWMSHAVNLRPKMALPTAELLFGNFLWPASAMAHKEDIRNDTSCYRFAREMRDAIQNVNVEFVEKLQKSDAPLNTLNEKSNEVATGETKRYRFSSLCNFQTYDVDFGWGKPEWVAMGGMFFKNFVVFLDAKEGETIEAWISLKEDEMARFEIDDELLSHVSSSKPNAKFRLMDAQSRL